MPPSSTKSPTPDAPWLTSPLNELWRWPLPHHADSTVNDSLNRLVLAVVRGRIRSITGLAHVHPARGAFIVAANHACRRDAVFLPAVLLMARGGLPVHFLADWNFKLIPGVASLYRRAGAITVNRKPARPAFLDMLKPLLGAELSPYEAARRALEDGRAVGLFPEGTTNRDGGRLLRGRHGCARLSLETGAPVVPVGISYPDHPLAPHKPLHAPVRLDFGPPMVPPPLRRAARADVREVRCWHAAVMEAIARRCGKPWQVPPPFDDTSTLEIPADDSHDDQGSRGDERNPAPPGT